MRQGARAYFTANIASQLFALLRYVVLARLLGPFELGLAATLILTAAFFEAVSDTGADRFLVQDKDGDSPTMQGVVHAVMAARGVFIAGALALSASLLAALYKAPDLQISLIALGAAPLIGGLAHLDMRRLQRNADFRPESWVMLVSETISLVATALAAWFTRDHTAVVYGLIARSIALVVASHLVARRPYRWEFAAVEARTFGVFAAPLAVNGLLLFLGTQGDRVVVGGALGPEALGHYSAVLLLAYYPTAMLGRFLSGLHLPQLSGAKTEPAAFATQHRSYAARMLLLSAAIIIGFALAGPIATPLLYGQGFAQPLQIFALLGALQSIRFVRLWPTNVAVSLGQSLIVMLNNVARMAALPLAFAAAALTPTLEAIIGAFIVGEVVALVAALILLSRAGALKLSREIARVLCLVFLSAAAIAAAWTLQLGQSIWALVASGTALASVALLVRLDWKAVQLDLNWVLSRMRRRS
ncbi:oligosaccharide flippase family protein [Phenylobacterium sp.]|uniref:oligosaccharide flippase family protein n=1 Tax=Phenylobacterium sp. TaxID=1871053 RepID=UPI0037C9C603